MRSLAAVRNYALLVFFVVMLGGILLKPGAPRSPAPPATHEIHAAGLAP